MQFFLQTWLFCILCKEQLQLEVAQAGHTQAGLHPPARQEEKSFQGISSVSIQNFSLDIILANSEYGLSSAGVGGRMDQAMSRSLAGSWPQDAEAISMPGGRVQDATPVACIVHPSKMTGCCQAGKTPPPAASTSANFNVDFNYDQFEIDVQGWMNNEMNVE